MTSVNGKKKVTSLSQLIRSILDTVDALESKQVSHNDANAKFNGMGRALKGIEINQRYGTKTDSGLNDIQLA